jgi:hypothetical protein
MGGSDSDDKGPGRPLRVRRADRVVWRIGPDRVLVRHIGATGDGSAADLQGIAALIWIALDEAMTPGKVVSYLRDAEIEVAEVDVHDTVDELLRTHWVTMC